jgi:PilZ domain
LGRLRASSAVDGLKELLQRRKLLRWAQPRELRIAALQAFHMIDPEQAPRLVPHSGIAKRELSLGPLAIDAENPWARQRRYRRVFPLKPMTAITSSTAGKAGLEIVSLSLGGGRARRQGRMQPGSDVTLHLQVALRKLDSRVLVREVTGSEISFEIADIGLADRSKLRQLLLSQTPSPSSPQSSRAAA